MIDFSTFQDSGVMQVLDEFYENLKAVGVSAVTGEGMDALFRAIDECRQEYLETFAPELERRAKVSANTDTKQSCSPIPILIVMTILVVKLTTLTVSMLWGCER